MAFAEAGYTVATRSFDAPHMRFNIADAHISALLLAGRIADAVDLAEGEAVALVTNGRSYITASEGVGTPLVQFRARR